MNDDIIKKMCRISQERNILQEMQDNENADKYLIIKNDSPQFGSLRQSMESTLRKTIGDITIKDDALKYYPDMNDVTLDGFISGVNIKFQFRLYEPSGVGVFITCADLQLSEENSKTIQKIRAAFLNWKNSFVEDDSIMKDLQAAARKAEQ